MDGDELRTSKKKIVSSWSDKEDLLNAFVEWFTDKSDELDHSLVEITKLILSNENASNWDKIVGIGKLFNNFSKYAAKQSLKTNRWSPKLHWAEISSIETKLRGNVFE